jgi:hypothetical protein
MGKKINIDHSAFKTGDLIFTSSNNPVASAIRFFTWGKAATFDTNFPNHVGVIVNMSGYNIMAEMLADGLELTSISHYDGSTFFGERICKVMRCKDLSQDDAKAINTEVARLKDIQTMYDFKGILQFLGLGKQVAARMFCSELCAYLMSMVKKIKDSDAVKWRTKNQWSPKDLLMFTSDNPSNWESVDNWQRFE